MHTKTHAQAHSDTQAHTHKHKMLGAVPNKTLPDAAGVEPSAMQ